jgi:hypothetical protein
LAASGNGAASRRAKGAMRIEGKPTFFEGNEFAERVEVLSARLVRDVMVGDVDS